MKKTLIIFDLDGTLIDSVPDLAAAVNAMLTELGTANASTEQVRSWVGNGSLVLTERALTWANLATDDAALHHAHERFLAHYADCASCATAPYAGVSAGLKTLKQAGFALAIATNKPARFLPEILAAQGWHDFDCVIGGDSLPTKKPDPTPLLHICDALGISPAAAIMVGDSKNDVVAGKNANITTLALSYGYNYDEPIAHSEPDAVFDEFADLVAFILKNFAE
ncbi:phosphoglycolate phosphatase [Moraxella caviae]|uniref:Phosphoglycolate phosphatase n=1 Tax=Moraxella caviae TaxID=34060 RepID=A0A1T0A1A1_9GAMM|nr:phosphoglycolate phosphatase [Moraxella caviae]OOR89379.1 phosphoglycolate phosphatase [Moraxella caviae]STZ09899.1 Phosphoglycolate phosphatase [Moraxella caviae]